MRPAERQRAPTKKNGIFSNAMRREVFVFARKFFEHEFYFVLEKSKTNNLYKPVFDVFF